MSGLVLKTRIDIETGQTEIVVLSTVFKSHKNWFYGTESTDFSHSHTHKLMHIGVFVYITATISIYIVLKTDTLVNKAFSGSFAVISP